MKTIGLQKYVRIYLNLRKFKTYENLVVTEKIEDLTLKQKYK